MIDRTTLIRSIVLLVPLIATLVVFAYRRPDRQLASGAFLASGWVLVGVLACHVAGSRAGWWTYAAEGGVLLGLPVDLWLGWALFWGALPVLAFPRTATWAVVAALAWLDIVLMPACWPVVRLQPRWLIGELVLVAVCLLPAQLLGRLTASRAALIVRASMQMVLFTGISLWMLPTIVLTLTGGSWLTLLGRPRWELSLALQALAVPAAVGASAVFEFMQRGDGTPFPGDPPRRLVTSGPYAYVANPMQLSMTAILFGLGVLLSNWELALAGPVAGAFGAGFAAWQEAGDLDSKFGEEWRRYRQIVRSWVPRWRPVSLGGANATLYFAASCIECSSVARWFQRHRPVGLDLAAAEDLPASMRARRVTYVAADGTVFKGVAALCRGADHLNLAWATLGWIVRLPLVLTFAQVVVDAVGGGERDIGRASVPAT